MFSLENSGDNQESGAEILTTGNNLNAHQSVQQLVSDPSGYDTGNKHLNRRKIKSMVPAEYVNNQIEDEEN